MKHLLLTIALASSFAAPGFAGEAAHGNKSGDTHGEMKIGMPGDAAAVDRTVEIVIEAYVRAVSNYDTTLHTICVEVEAAMATDVTRGGSAKDCKLAQTEFDFSDEGDRPIGTARLTYAIDYRTAENLATTPT